MKININSLIDSLHIKTNENTNHEAIAKGIKSIVRSALMETFNSIPDDTTITMNIDNLVDELKIETK